MAEVFVGCGSNINAAENLRWALVELEARFGPVRCSSVYQCPAFGFEGPDFLNMVVVFDTDDTADTVEAVLSALENARGRDSGERSGSRTLDLDLLLLGGRIDARQRLPRTDVLRYAFVLAPLAELAPGLRHPVTGVRMADAWQPGAKEAASLTVIDTLDAA